MGLHLPARTVVIGELKKFNGRSFEPLTATEYRQMTGRAGRRGIDTRGVAVLVPSPYLPFEQTFRTMSGEPEPLQSAFELRYNTLLNTYRADDEERILVLLENNLAEYHRRQEARERGRRRERRRGLRTRLYAMLDVLYAERLMDRDGDLKTKGLIARHIFNPWELVVTAVLLDGSLAHLEPAGVVEALSLFIPSKFAAPEDEPRRAYYARRLHRPRRPLSPLDEIAATIETLVTRLRGREGRQGIELTPEWTKPDHRFVRAWCEHGRLSETVEEYEVPAGDALQLLGQTLDLLEQCVHALSDVFGADDHHVAVIRRAIAAISQGGKLERLLGL
jgi:superfamily II RNA helicase